MVRIRRFGVIGTVTVAAVGYAANPPSGFGQG